MKLLPTVKTGLRRHPVDNQLLIYDSANEQVHLLDPTTACVLELLEAGWTEAGIRAEIPARLGVPFTDELLLLALDQLLASGLLVADEGAPALLVDVKRREMLRKVAIGGVATLLAPAIATMTASSAYAATLLADCASCSANTDCLSGACKGTIKHCVNLTTCKANGSTCTASTSCTCCTGNCTGSGGTTCG